MKKLNKLHIGVFTFILLLITISNVVLAQQPLIIPINTLETYNVNNRVYYLITNNEKELNLTIRTGDGYANEKSIFGITFTIKPVEKGSKSKGAMSIRYPSVVEIQKRDPIRFMITSIRRLQSDTARAAKLKIDSLKTVLNKRFDETFQEIELSNVPGLNQQLLSIRNLEGIMVKMQLNDNLQLTYHLTLPVKFIENYVIDGHKYKFNIKMNGVPEKSPSSPYSTPTIKGNPMQTIGVDNAYVMYPTDFSGEYTLATKP